MSQTAKTIIIAAIAGIATAFIGVKIMLPESTAVEAADHANEFVSSERPMVNKLRCAYATWPPYLYKDPNTGELKGINCD